MSFFKRKPKTPPTEADSLFLDPASNQAAESDKEPETSLPEPVDTLDSTGEPAAEDTSDTSVAPLTEPAKEKKGFRSLFGRKKPAEEDAPNVNGSDATPPVPVRKGGFFRRKERTKFDALPIRVIIGFLPEVNKRDAQEYALGIAEKHFENIGMAYFEAYPYNNGYVYEVHEGGDGRGYAPEILRYFDAQGPYRTGERVLATIRTATRTLEVQRTRDGLTAVLLPETSEVEQSEWLVPTTKMTQALNRRTGFFAVGVIFFLTGFIGMISASMLTRYQEYEEAPPPRIEQVSATNLPHMQWNRLLRVYERGNYVKALRFRNGVWEEPETAPDVPVTEEPTPETPPAN